MRKTNNYITRVLASLVLGSLVLSCTEPAAEKDAAYTHFFVTAEDVANPADENAPFGRKWSKGEEVSVWNGKTLSIFTSSQENKGKTSLFFGETENTGNFLVCYPAGKPEESYTIPDTVDEIAAGCFAYAKNLKTVEIPDSVLYVDNWSFAYSKIESIALPDSVIEVDDYAFAYCENLSDVDLGNGIHDPCFQF